MSVWNQAAGHQRLLEEGAQDLDMARAGLGDPGCLTGEPVLNLVPRRLRGSRLLHHARVRHQSDEGKQRWPRQSHLRVSIELSVEPLAGDVVLGGRGVGGVNQQVGIDEDHR